MASTFQDKLQIEIEFLSKNQASLDQLLLSLSNIDKLLKAVEADAAGAGAINKVFNKEGLANFERTLQQTQKSIEAITEKRVDLTIFSGGGKQAEERGARLLNILEQVGKTVAALNGRPFNLDLSSVAKAKQSFTELQGILGSLKDTPGFKALPQGVRDTLEQVTTSASAQVKKIAKLPDDVLRDIGGASFKKKIGEQQVALLKELFASFTQNAKTELGTIQAAYEATKKQLATATAEAEKLKQKVKTLEENIAQVKTKAKARGTDGDAAPKASKASAERQKVIVDVEVGKVKQPDPPPVIKVEAEITKVRQPDPPPVIKVTAEVDKVTVPKAQKIKIEAEIVTKGQGGDPIADIIKGFKRNERIDEQAATALSKYVNDLRAAKIEVEKYRKALEDARAAGDKPGALQAGKNLQAAAAQYATLRSEYSALATTIKKISEHADSAKFGEEKVRRLGEQAKSAFEALDSADKKIREFGKLRSTAQENAFLQQEKKLLAEITAQITELGNEARIAGVKFKEKGPLDDLARELQLLTDITEIIKRLGDAARATGTAFQGLTPDQQKAILDLQKMESALRRVVDLRIQLEDLKASGKLSESGRDFAAGILPRSNIGEGTAALNKLGAGQATREIKEFTDQLNVAEREVRAFLVVADFRSRAQDLAKLRQEAQSIAAGFANIGSNEVTKSLQAYDALKLKIEDLDRQYKALFIVQYRLAQADPAAKELQFISNLIRQYQQVVAEFEKTAAKLESRFPTERLKSSYNTTPIPPATPGSQDPTKTISLETLKLQEQAARAASEALRNLSIAQRQYETQSIAVGKAISNLENQLLENIGKVSSGFQSLLATSANAQKAIVNGTTADAERLFKAFNDEKSALDGLISNFGTVGQKLKDNLSKGLYDLEPTLKQGIEILTQGIDAKLVQFRGRLAAIADPLPESMAKARALAVEELDKIQAKIKESGFDQKKIREEINKVQSALGARLEIGTPGQGAKLAAEFIQSYRDAIEAKMKEIIQNISGTSRSLLENLGQSLNEASERVLRLKAEAQRLASIRDDIGATPTIDRRVAMNQAALVAAENYLTVLQQTAVVQAQLIRNASDPSLTAEEQKKLEAKLKLLQAEREYIQLLELEAAQFRALAQASVEITQLRSKLGRATDDSERLAIAEEIAKRELLINEAKGQKLISQEQRIAAARAEEYRKLVEQFGQATQSQVAEATRLLEEGAAKRRAIEQGITADMEVELKKRIQKAQEFKPTQTIGGQKFSTSELFKDTAPQTLKALQELTEKEKQLNAERQALLVRSTGERIKAYEVELQRVQDVINRQTEATRTAYTKENEEQARRIKNAKDAYAELSKAQEAALKLQLATATAGSDTEKQITAKLAVLLAEREQVRIEFGQRLVAAETAYTKKIEQVEADSLRASQQALANRNAATLKELAEYGKTIGGLVAKIEAEFVKLGGGTAAAGNAGTQIQTLLKNFKELGAFVGNNLSQNIGNYAKSLGNLFVDQERLTTQLGNIKRELKEFTEGRGSIVGLTGSFIGLFNALGPVNQGLILLGASAKLAVSQMKELTDRVLMVSKEQTNLQRFTQVSVETLEALRLGIERAGGMAFFLESSLQSLGNAIQTTSLDATSKQAQAFEFFGVAATDAAGNARKMEEVILDLSSAFQDTGKRGNLKAIQDLFGFFGTKGVVSSLITLEQLQKQVKETGTAISLDAEGPLRDYQISIFEMDHAVKAFEVTMAKQFGPTLAVVNKSLTGLLETVTHFLSLDINRGIVNVLLKGLEAVVGILTNVTALLITIGTTILALGPTVFRFVQKTASGFVALTGDIRAATKALIEMEAQAKKTALAAQGIRVPPVVAPSGGGGAQPQGKGIAAAFGTAGISIFAILGPILAELITGFYRDAAAAAEEEAVKQAAGANKLLLQVKKAFDEGSLGKSTQENLAKYQELQAELAKGNSGYVESALRTAAAENRVGLSYRESAAEVKRLESALKTLARERASAITQVDERGRQGEFGTGNDVEIRKLQEKARLNQQFDDQETENLRRQIALKEQFAAKEIQQNKDFQAILSQLRSTTDERQRRELLNRLQFEGKVGQEFVKLYEDLSAKEIEIAERKSKERIDIEKATQEAVRRERERTSRELQQSLDKESILLEEANQKNRGTPVERERRRADIDQSRIRERINTASGTIGGFEQAEEIKKQQSYVNELREAFKKLDIERAQAIEDLSKGTVFGGKATVDALNKVIKTTSVMVNGQRVTREEFERLAKTAEEAYATISEKAEQAAETDREIAKGTIEGYNNVLNARLEQLEKERSAVNTTTVEGAARAKAIEEEITRIREAQSSQRIETIEREAREVAVRQRAEVEGTKASAEEIEQIRRDKAAAEKDLENQKLRDSIAIQRAQTETELLELRKRETAQENNFRQFLLNQEKRRASGASEVTLQSELLVAQDRRFAESISNLRQQIELEKQLNGENEQTLALEGQLADLEAQRIQARQGQAQNVINAYKGQADGYRAIAEQVAYLQLEEEGQFLSSQEYARREIEIKKEVLQASIAALETEIAFRQANNLAIEETLRLQAELLGQVRELKALERGGPAGGGAAGAGRSGGTYGFGGQQIEDSIEGMKKAIEQIRQIQEAVTMNVIMGFFDAFAAGIVNQNYERQIEDLYRRISDVQKREAQKLKEEAIAQAKDRAKQIVEIAKQQAEAELAAAENLEQALIDLGNRFDELAQDNLDRIAEIDQRYIEDSKKYWADYQKYLTDKAFEEQQQRARDEAESLRSLARAQADAAKRRLDFAREQFRAERDLRKAQRDLAKDQGDAQKEYRDLISQLNEARAAGDSAKVEDLSQQLNEAEARLKELEEQAQALAAEAETNKKRRELETERQKELAEAARKAAAGEITREEFDILKENINDKYDLEQDYLSDRLEAIKANDTETLVELDKAYDEQRMALEEAKNAELAYAKTIRELDKADRDKALNEERQGWIDRLNEINSNYQKELAAQQEAYKKEYDALVKQRRELLVEYQKSLLDIELSTKGQLEEIGASYDDFFKRVKDGFKGVEDKAKLTIQAIATVFKNLQNILTGKPIDEQVDDALNGGGSGGPSSSSGGGKPGGTGGGSGPRGSNTGGGGPTSSSGNTGGGGNQSGGGQGDEEEEEGEDQEGGGASSGPVRLPPTVWEYIRQWATGKITINELNAKLNSLRSKGTITKEQYDQAQKEIAKLKERFNDSNLPGLGSGNGAPPGGGGNPPGGGTPPGGGGPGSPPGGGNPDADKAKELLGDEGKTFIELGQFNGNSIPGAEKKLYRVIGSAQILASKGFFDQAKRTLAEAEAAFNKMVERKALTPQAIRFFKGKIESTKKTIEVAAGLKSFDEAFGDASTTPPDKEPGGGTPPDKEPGGTQPGGGKEPSEADIQKQFESDKAQSIKLTQLNYENALKDKDLPDWAKELAEKVRKGEVPYADALKIAKGKEKDLTRKQKEAVYSALEKADTALGTESGRFDESIRNIAKLRVKELTGGKFIDVSKEELDTARAKKVSEYDTKLQGVLSQGKDLPEWARKLLDAVRKGETSADDANDILRKKRNELSEQQYNLIAEGINAAGLAQQYESGQSDFALTDQIRQDKFKESGGDGPGDPGPTKPGRFGTVSQDKEPSVGDLPKSTDIKISGEKLINVAFEKVRKGEWTTTFAASYLNAIGGIDITKEQYGKAMKMLEDYASGRESSLGTFTDPQDGLKKSGRNTGVTPGAPGSVGRQPDPIRGQTVGGLPDSSPVTAAPGAGNTGGLPGGGAETSPFTANIVGFPPDMAQRMAREFEAITKRYFDQFQKSFTRDLVAALSPEGGQL